ncbi:hypothetical protein [Motilibacter aurantiacus]|uniref:hypothetical protein n=1 Tax=Motilibacter aurantiacus TaxID=2714955 RepID=UPI0014079EB7|nr:hypothetical protein [Motilibacter aurantiacus]NHC45622.1 hypothetical protein [Motilibacter aurantiacus]
MHLDTSLCPACSAATAGGTSCQVCGLPTTVPPRRRHSPLGELVTVRRLGGGAEPGVVLGADGGTLTVLTRGGEAEHAARAVQAADGHTPAATRTEPGALLHAAAALSAVAGLDGVPAERLREVALGRAVAAPESVVGFAHDAAAAGDFEALEALRLPEPFRALLEIEAWLAREDWNAAAAAVADLPAGSFPRLLPAVARLVARLPGRTPYAPGLARWLAAHEPHPVAVVARAALDAGTALGTGVTAALRALPGVTVGTTHAHAQLAAGEVPVLAAAQAPALVPLAAAAGTAFNPALVRPGLLDERTFDDLVDSGTLTVRQLAGLREHPHLDPAYVTARLDPTLLSDAEVAGLRFVDEEVRRALSAGSRAGLAGRATHPYVLAAQQVRRFLAGDDAAEQHVVALHGPAEAAALGLARRVVQEAPGGLPGDRQLRGRYVAAAALATLQRHGLEDVPDEGLGALQRVVVAVAAVRRAQELVFDGEWDAAAVAAETALRLARDPVHRDEARNLLACAAFHGRRLASPGLLDEALAGTASPALLLNAALLAGDTPAAVQHLARVVDTAPDPAVRAGAGQRALRLLQAQRNGPLAAVPPVLRGPLRRLAGSDLTLEQLRALLEQLCVADRDWLAAPGALAGSPHCSTVEARYFAARAAGLPQALHAMADGLRAPEPPAWLEEERDVVLRSLCAAMSGEESALWAGEAALTALDVGMPMSRDQRVLLTALGCRELALATLTMPDSGMARLDDAQVDQLVWAARNAHRVSGTLRDRAQGLCRDSATKVQWTLIHGIAAEHRTLSPHDPAYSTRVAGLRAELGKLHRYVDGEARRATDALLDLLG